MAGRYLLGFDVGSSSVKASLVDADSGVCVASAFYPEKEASVIAVKSGWAEQELSDVVGECQAESQESNV